MNKKTFNFDNMDMELNKNEVHIWQFDLNNFIDNKDLLKEILARDELRRVDSFAFCRLG